MGEENTKQDAREIAREKLALALAKIGLRAFEYDPQSDQWTEYDDTLAVKREIPNYLHYIKRQSDIVPIDRQKAIDFYQGKIREPIEVYVYRNGQLRRTAFTGVWLKDPQTDRDYMVGTARDVTVEKNREETLREQIRKDALTGVYNAFSGREKIQEYLEKRTPGSSCALMVIDIDYFKKVNDTYGHLFGDTVLVALTRVLTAQAGQDGVVMRAGGDEFVLFLPKVSHPQLMRKSAALIEAIRGISFSANNYHLTCSVGVCFLAENVLGYNYEQVFHNADWALYQAKARGRDQYAFCDNLKRCKVLSVKLEQKSDDLPLARLTGNGPEPDYDSLTGLVSIDRFRKEAQRLIESGNAVGLWMVYSDFEDFKYFNQKYGYSAGDLLLKEFSDFIIRQDAQTDPFSMARVTADQFVILRIGPEPEETIAAVNRCNELFAASQSVRFPGVRMRIRSGIYRIGADCPGASQAIDAANYARKQITRATEPAVVLYDEKMSRRQVLEREVISEFDGALERGEFVLYFQPRVCLTDYRIVGAEALIRWKRADGRLLVPGDFLPYCEDSGRIRELDFYIFEKVLQFLKKNQDQGRNLIPISVNASILHASDREAAKRYLDIAKKYDVDPGFLKIELTETAASSCYDNVKQLFGRLRQMGFRTSLDDFGAGYSLLNAVLDVPVDEIKIDRGFIEHCEGSERGREYFRQIVSMVRGLGHEVICEGVENVEQVEMILAAGCVEAQGYLFSEPMSEEDFEQLFFQNS